MTSHLSSSIEIKYQNQLIETTYGKRTIFIYQHYKYNSHVFKVFTCSYSRDIFKQRTEMIEKLNMNFNCFCYSLSSQISRF